MPLTDEARRRAGEAALALLGWAYVVYAFSLRSHGFPGIPLCPWRLLTATPCPLCGTTRSWNAALHGDWDFAFAMHPVAPFVLPVWIVATLLFSVRTLASVQRAPQCTR